MKRAYFFSIIFLMLSTITFNLKAQEKSTVNAIPEIEFIQWIQQLEKSYEVQFSYNSSLVEKLIIPYAANCTSLKSCLQFIEENAPLKFEEIEDNEFILVPVRATAYFTVIEKENKKAIVPINIKLNKDLGRYLFPEKGHYKLADLFPTDSIHIYATFHQTVHLTAADLFGNQQVIEMIPDTFHMNEVIIKNYMGEGIDNRLDNHSLTVSMKNLGLLSGETDGDVLTTLKNIPGIRTPDGKPGSLNFRGSSFDQTMIFFDDVPIYHTGHFLGTISPYNPLAVDQVNIHRGISPAKWGGRVGGLINMKTDDKLTDSSSYAALINTLYAGASVKQVIVKNKLGISLAYRSNYLGNYLSPKLEEFSNLNFQGSRISASSIGSTNNLDQFDVNFHDLNGKLIYQINPKHKATLSFINIDNNFASDFNSPNQNMLEKQRIDLENWGYTGKINSTFSKNTQASLGITKSSLSIFDYNQTLRNDSVEQFESVTNKIDDIRLISEVKTKIKSKHELSGGYSFTEHKISFDESSLLNAAKQEHTAAQIHALHTAIKMNWDSRWIATLGLHSDYYQPFDKPYLDPRLFLTYRLNEYFFLKSSGGRSHQFIQQLQRTDFDDFRINNQFWFLPKTKSGLIESYQGMLGVLFKKSTWLLDIEIYQKHTNNIQTQNAARDVFNGSTDAMGLDLFIKKEWQSIETWLSYSYSNIESTFETTQTSFYDQPHLFNITTLYHLKKWNFSLSWSYASGMLVIIPEIDPTDPNNNGQSELMVPYDERFPDQHQLDFSSTYRFSIKNKKWKGLIGISINNVYNQENIINIFQSNLVIDNPYRKAIGFAPNAHLSISF